MTWTRGYISGSFRGVAFKTERSSQMGGRRLVEHVFPERDNAYFEDLGKVNHRFTLNLYVIGDDYYKQRNDLISALDESDTGILIHPYRGTLLVKVDSWDVVEDVSEGRMARFTATFVLDTEIFLTIVGPNPIDKLQQAKANYFDRATAALQKVYSVVSRPTAILQDVVNMGNQALNVVETAKKITRVYEEYQAKIDSIKGQMLELVQDIELLARDFIGAIDFGTDPFDPLVSAVSGDDLGKSQFAELKQIVDLQTQTLTAFPAIADSEDYYPGTEIQTFVARAAMGSRAGLVGAMTIRSVTEANSILADLGAELSTIEDDPLVDDDLYAATRDLRTAVADVLSYRRLSLDQLVTEDLVEFEPSLVMAWRRYKAVDREEDVIGYNQVFHPGFVPAGQILVPRD